MPDALPLRRPRAVTPRHAASLVLLRNGREVLMGLRGARHRFMPHLLVFPGGAVDPGDARAPVATELRPHTQAMLEKSARPPLARAIAYAAARELEEETGLRLGAPPALDGLEFICRAVTPPDRPIRFNARFLLLDAARVTGTLGGSGELEDLRWYPVEEALARGLHPVTSGVLLRMRELLALPETERRTVRPAPLFLRQVWKLE